MTCMCFFLLSGVGVGFEFAARARVRRRWEGSGAHGGRRDAVPRGAVEDDAGRRERLA